MDIDTEDEKVFKNFEGRIVKKDLVNSLKGQINVPAYVLEYDYLKSTITKFAVDKSLDDYDFHFQVVNIMQAKEGSQTASAFFIALYSALMNIPAKVGSVVLGEITIQGGVLPVQDFADCVNLAKENGARKMIVPIGNSKEISSLPAEILQGLEVSFYSDPKECLVNALEGLG